MDVDEGSDQKLDLLPYCIRQYGVYKFERHLRLCDMYQKFVYLPIYIKGKNLKKNKK